MKTKKTVYECAKDYVERLGFSVFPLPCKSKKPFAGWNWKPLQARKPTLKEIQSWFSRPVNIAIVTGNVSDRLQVLDFDDMDVFGVWKEHARLMTLDVMTGKGVHCYFRLADGVGFNGDFFVGEHHAGQARYDGGYVVAPPSVHPSGVIYSWRDEYDILTVPTLNALGITPKNAWENLDRTSQQRNIEKSKPCKTNPVEQYAEKAIFFECERIREATPGTRNNAVFRSALKLKKYVPTCGESVVKQAIIDAGEFVGLSEEEVKRTITSAWKIAKY